MVARRHDALDGTPTKLTQIVAFQSLGVPSTGVQASVLLRRCAAAERLEQLVEPPLVFVLADALECG